MRRIAFLIGALCLGWLIPIAAGGEGVVPPLVVLGPVLYAAVHGGLRWSLPAALAAAVLSGPLTPENVSAGDAQHPREWLSRGAVFVAAAVIVSMERRRAASRRRADALRDGLTGLPTAEVLDVHLQATLAQARRSGEAVAVTFLDVDDFAGVNEALGHATGDRLLQEIACRLDGERRAGDLIARHAGDEFLIVLGRLDPRSAEEAAIGAVHRLLRTLDRPVGGEDAEIALQATAGVSLFPRDAQDGAALRRHAAAALRTAKATQRRCVLYERSGARPLANRTLAARLRRAVDRGDLELHHQPIWSLDSASIVGVECLVRWRDADGAMISPADFVPIAEQTGVIHPMGSWVLAESCDAMARWARLGLLPNFGVNVSPFQLARPGLAADVHAELRRTGIATHRLLLEITESAWTLDAQRVRPQLDAMRAGGLKLAMDDFGAGHSSLGRLADLPVSVLKIDRALLGGVPSRPAAIAVLRAAVQLADAVGCDVVAEGIETEEQRDELRRLGVGLGQGFLMARPMPEEQLTPILLEHLAPSRRAEIGAGT
jgi:diguanylate cyclase (GGDEF)-like protein